MFQPSAYKYLDNLEWDDRAVSVLIVAVLAVKLSFLVLDQPNLGYFKAWFSLGRPFPRFYRTNLKIRPGSKVFPVRVSPV